MRVLIVAAVDWENVVNVSNIIWPIANYLAVRLPKSQKKQKNPMIEALDILLH